MNSENHVLVNWILVKILLMNSRKKTVTYIEYRRQDPWRNNSQMARIDRSKIRIRTEEDDKSSKDVC